RCLTEGNGKDGTENLMTGLQAKAGTAWRLVVVGGHTRSIGKTQLVCDIIAAFPKTEWIAGKITQYGHGVCAQDWETHADTGTDSARFLAAGARRSFCLRTKQGYLAEGLPLLRQALEEVARRLRSGQASGEWRVASEQGRSTAEPSTALILESNSLMQFVKPSLYFAVIDPL